MDKERASIGTSLADGVSRAKIPTGYKRTEAGVIPGRWCSSSVPAGWTVRSLRSCLRTSPAYGINAAAAPSDDRLPTYLRITDISDEHRFRPSPRVAIEHPNAPAFFLQEGDLVFARTGASVGKSYLYDPADGPLVFAGFLIRVQPNEDVQPAFLAYCVQSERYWGWVASTSSRSGQPGINGKEYGTYQLWLPPLDEQHAIVEALSDVDELIESLDALIAKKQAVKQATMQQLLTGKTRLPGFSGVWETKRLGEVASIRKGQLITESSIKPGTVPVIAGGKKPAYFHNRANRTGKTITVSASGAYAGYVAYWNGPIFASDCSTISETPNYSIQWLFYQMMIAQEQIYHAQIGGAQPHVHGRDLGPLIISMPPIREQTSIAAILSDMDAEIAALERRLDKTRTLKQGMMQQLLTGRIRLIESVETTTRRASATSSERKHNWQFNEAVVIAVLTKHFGDKKYPLSRMRYTKLSYLLHRHAEGRAEGYLKKAAGPYNPNTRYSGPEKIAQTNDYVCRHKSNRYSGFIIGENVKQAEIYFAKWYGEDCLKWLDQFRYEKRDELELLTTVDLAVEELRETGKAVSVEDVKNVIHSDPEWKAKLNRSVFSNANIARAIERCRRLFSVGGGRPEP